MLAFLYEEYEYDKTARKVYYGLLIILCLSFLYIILFKPESISQWIAYIIMAIVMKILQHLYDAGFHKKPQREGKK